MPWYRHGIATLSLARYDVIVLCDSFDSGQLSKPIFSLNKDNSMKLLTYAPTPGREWRIICFNNIWYDKLFMPNLRQTMLEQGKSEGFESCDRPIVRKRTIWVKIGDVFNRASLLCYFKLCAPFQRHRWIQTGITVQKHPIWVKIDDFFLSRVTLKFDGRPLKAIGPLSYATSSSLHHFIVIGDFKLELQSGNCQVGFWHLQPWPLISDLDLLHGNHFCHWQ